MLQVKQPLATKGNGEPVVVGAMVLDIQACPVSNDIRPGTTSPGEVPSSVPSNFLASCGCPVDFRLSDFVFLQLKFHRFSL